MTKTIEAVRDPTSKLFETSPSTLTALLEPRNVAVFGATPDLGTVGHGLLKNLLDAPFYGNVFPINAAGESIFDITSYTSIQAVPDRVDLAIITTPLSIVPSILADCVEAGVKSAIVISPGFRETGAIGRTLETQLREKLRLGDMRLLGPNSLGVMNPRKGLNATLSGTMARPGNIGFISQSGALCRAVLDWSFYENVGFSAFVSMGSMLDVNWGDLISYLGDDPHTQSIVIHMESVGDVRSFLAAAREVAQIKPIILLKGGRTEAAVKAAIAHTGGIVGSDDVFEAALQRCGVLQVNRISELFNMAEVLAKRRFAPPGKRLTIVTNSGGLGVLATDALIMTGGQLADLTPTTLDRLNEVLPSDWSRSNPVDILGDADGDRFQKAIEIAVQDPHTDGILVILAPQGVADPTDTAEKLKDLVNQLQTSPLRHKPILASWVGGAEVIAGETMLNRYQIPTYPYPDSAARLFNLMWQHSYSLDGMAEMPTLADHWSDDGPHRSLVETVIHTAQQAQRTLLTAMETETVLTAYGLPTVETHLAHHEGQAAAIAKELGYPIIVRPSLEIDGALATTELLAHDSKSLCDAYHRFTKDLLGSSVILQPLIDAAGAYELMLSSEIDSQFGPVVRFGTGKWSHDIYGNHAPDHRRHRAVALPPLNEALAQRLIEQTVISPALRGERGIPAVDLAALQTLIVRFAQLVAEQPWIRSIQLNPVLVRPLEAGQKASDRTPSPIITNAHIELQPADQFTELPKPLFRPYPSQYTQVHPLADGTPFLLRPVRPSDIPALRAFHEDGTASTSEIAASPLPSLTLSGTAAQITRRCYRHYDREMTLVAELTEAPPDGSIKGVGRLQRLPDGTSGEVIVALAPAYADTDLGRILLDHLIHVARQEGIQALQAAVVNNPTLSTLCQTAGFSLPPRQTNKMATLPIRLKP